MTGARRAGGGGGRWDDETEQHRKAENDGAEAGNVTENEKPETKGGGRRGVRAKERKA